MIKIKKVWKFRMIYDILLREIYTEAVAPVRQPKHKLKKEDIDGTIFKQLK